MNSVRHLELFSGIGGFRSAFDHLGLDYGFDAECVGFSEIDRYASLSYKSNYDVSGCLEIGDIVTFTESRNAIEDLKDFDFLTGGFPCQAFSMMGSQRGFEDERGNLFFNIIKILEIKRPPFVLLENVRNLVRHDGGNTFRVIRSELEKLGYHVHHDIFNTADFGLAQTRNRVYIFCSLQKLPPDFEFTSECVKNSFSGRTSLLMQKDVTDVLSKKADEKYYLSDKIKPTILADGSAGFQSCSDINQLIARPLTATMVKMHRACQDNYYSDGFIESGDPYEYSRIRFSKEELARQRIRKLTPEEAYELQGFPRNMAGNARKAGVSEHQLYKQAGNAASVNVIYAILKYLLVDRNVMGNVQSIS